MSSVSWDPWSPDYVYTQKLMLFGTTSVVITIICFVRSDTDDRRVVIKIKPAIVKCFKDMGVDLERAINEDAKLHAAIEAKWCNWRILPDKSGGGFINIAFYGKKHDTASCIDGVVKPWLTAAAANDAARLLPLAGAHMNDANAMQHISPAAKNAADAFFDSLGAPAAAAAATALPPQPAVADQHTNVVLQSIASGGETNELGTALGPAPAAAAPLQPVKNEQALMSTTVGKENSGTALADGTDAEAATTLAHMHATVGATTDIPAAADDAALAEQLEAANELKNLEAARASAAFLQQNAENAAAAAAAAAETAAVAAGFAKNAQELVRNLEAACHNGKRKRE